MLLVLAAALILSGVLARRLSKRIVDPLNRLDLDHPLHSGSYEELAPLLGRINQQHREISSQLRTLRRKTDEFDQITGSMKEGLVLLDNAGVVLSINPAAQRLYGVSRASVGQDFLTVDRSRDMSRAIADAVKNGHSEVRSERGGRAYQFDLSRIESGGETVGAVLLAFDVTDQEYAERSRREFTANVSHELKTPLQGIIGSAELIEQRYGKARGSAPLRRAYPRRGVAPCDADRRHHPPVRSSTRAASCRPRRLTSRRSAARRRRACARPLRRSTSRSSVSGESAAGHGRAAAAV